MLARRNANGALYAHPLVGLLLLLVFLFSNLSIGRPVEETPAPSGGQPVPNGSERPGDGLHGKVIVVDPGHGGPGRSNAGAVGVGPTPEKDNVLAIGLALKQMLEQAGARVVMTRTGDYSPAYGEYSQLEARTALANRSGADVYVSIHNDWNPNPAIFGTTTYYYFATAEPLARCIQEETVKALGSRDLGYRYHSFHVIRATSMPSVLVEVGFLSNRREANLLSETWYRRLAARGIFNGLRRYFSGR